MALVPGSSKDGPWSGENPDSSWHPESPQLATPLSKTREKPGRCEGHQDVEVSITIARPGTDSSSNCAQLPCCTYAGVSKAPPALYCGRGLRGE